MILGPDYIVTNPKQADLCIMIHKKIIYPDCVSHNTLDPISGQFFRN